MVNSEVIEGERGLPPSQEVSVDSKEEEES